MSCHAERQGHWFTTFRKKVPSSSSGIKDPKKKIILRLFAREYEAFCSTPLPAIIKAVLFFEMSAINNPAARNKTWELNINVEVP